MAHGFPGIPIQFTTTDRVLIGMGYAAERCWNSRIIRKITSALHSEMERQKEGLTNLYQGVMLTALGVLDGATYLLGMRDIPSSIPIPPARTFLNGSLRLAYQGMKQSASTLLVITVAGFGCHAYRSRVN